MEPAKQILSLLVTIGRPLLQSTVEEKLDMLPGSAKEPLHFLKSRGYIEMVYNMVSGMNENIRITIMGETRYVDRLNSGGEL